MGDKKVRDSCLKGSTIESKSESSGLQFVGHVLTKITPDRAALDKFSQQLDREKRAKELEFRQEKQKLLLRLRKLEAKKKEWNDRGTCDNTRQKTLNLKITAATSPNRCRSYSAPDTSSLGLLGLKLRLCDQRCDANGWQDSADAHLSTRETLGSDTNACNHAALDKASETFKNDRCGEINDGVNKGYTEHTTNSDITEMKFKRPRALSDHFSTLVLPPIHQSCMAKPLQREKVSERQRAIDGKVSGCGGTETYQTAVAAKFDDLKDRRYIRKVKFQSSRQ